MPACIHHWIITPPPEQRGQCRECKEVRYFPMLDLDKASWLHQLGRSEPRWAVGPRHEGAILEA